VVIARWRRYGSGRPVTLVAHGLGATDGEARLPASGLGGTRVVVTFGSHGDAPDAPPGYWDYGVLAAELREVAEEVGARQAVGVSMGAGALVRLASEDPERFERLALLQPAALDRPRTAEALRVYRRLADAVAASDRAALLALVRAGMPTCCGDLGDYLERRADALLRLGEALRALPALTPVADASALAAVSARTVVITGVGDPLHPESVAAATSAALRAGELHVLGSPCPLVSHRAQVRELLTNFLSPVRVVRQRAAARATVYAK
jgi:3-oxoadipate enol-lactonase